MKKSIENIYRNDNHGGKINDITNTICIVPRSGDKGLLKSTIYEYNKSQKIDCFVLPEIVTLFDLAVKIADVGVDKVLYETDFKYLMVNLGKTDVGQKINKKFTDPNNTAYRSYLFALINNLLFSDKSFNDHCFYDDLRETGLTDADLDGIVGFIRSQGFVFRADVYRSALNSSNAGSPFIQGKTIFYFPGEFYTKLESDLLIKIGAISHIPQEYSSENPVDIVKKAVDSFKDNKSFIFRSVSAESEQFRYIYQHLRKEVKESNNDLSYSNYGVYCSNSSTLNAVTSYLTSKNIPVVSSARTTYHENESLLICAFETAITRSVNAAVDFYNLYLNPFSPVKVDTGNSEPDIGYFTASLKNEDNRYSFSFVGEYNGKNERDKFLNYMKTICEMSDSQKKSYNDLKDILNMMDSLGKRIGIKSKLITFQDAIKKLFDDKPQIIEVIKYLSEVLASKNTIQLSESFVGVKIFTPDSIIPDVKKVFILDLEDSRFLRDSFTNKLLLHSDFLEFEKEIYGVSKEHFLAERFASLIGSSVEDINFLLPNYDEGTIVSRYMDIFKTTDEMPYKVIPDKLNISAKGSFKSDFTKIDQYEPKKEVETTPRLKEFSIKYKGDDVSSFLKKNLTSATKIESFVKCPTRFLHDLEDKYQKIESKERFDKGNAFHEFAQRFLKRIRDNSELFSDIVLPERTKSLRIKSPIKNYIKGTKQNSFIHDIFDAVGISEIFDELKAIYKNLKLNDKDYYNYADFIVKFIVDIVKKIDKEVTKTFRFEVQLGNFTFKDLDITINKGYADFLFIDRDKRLHIIDFKSGEVKKYKDEFDNFRVAQLPIYREIVKSASGSYFRFDEPKTGSETIDEDYVKSAGSIVYSYVSFKDSTETTEPKDYDLYFSNFTDKLKGKFTDALSGNFRAERNCDCDYCCLNAVCTAPDNETDKMVKVPTEVFSDFPFRTQDVSKIDDKRHKKVFIQFDENKAKGVSNLSDDIVISAGAGAGKTEVLSSRFVNILINGTKLENIVCITFTNKAAGEMKKRILSKIDDTLAVGSFFAIERSDNNYSLNDDQKRCLIKARESFYDKNRITTFHSFCIDTMDRFRKYDDEGDLETTITDEALFREEMYRILNNGFKNDFIDLLTDEKGKTAFKEWIEYQQIYYSGDFGKGGVIPSIIDFMDRFSLSGQNYDDVLSESLDDFTLHKKSKLEADQELFEKYKKKDNDELTEKEFYIRRAILNLSQKLLSDIEDYKLANGLSSLNDFHVGVIKLLENKPEVLNKLKSEIKHLLIDEFQDTNWLQKRIIELLHPNSEANKLFIVGDLKQSIYRFQQCDNQIFEVYRDSCSNYLTFTENNRSVSDIIDFNNHFFSNNNFDPYNIFYHTSKDKNKVELAQYPSYKEKQQSEKPCITIAEFGYKKTDEADGEENSAENLRVKESEGFYIAKTIKLSKDQGVDFNNWGVLVRSYTNVTHILEALNNCDIPYSFVMKRDFFKLTFIREAINILKAIYGIALTNEVGYDDNLLGLCARLKNDEDLKKRGVEYCLNTVIASKEYNSTFLKKEDGDTSQELLFTLIGIINQLSNSSQGKITDLFTGLDRMIEENSVGIETHKRDAVKIMTIHSSKGLEFEHLIVANVSPNDNYSKDLIKFINKVEGENQNWIDHTVKGIKEFDGEIKDGFWYSELLKMENTFFDETEKANLLYVALTRAKKSLTVTMLRNQINPEKGECIKKTGANWVCNIESNLFDAFGIDPLFDVKTISKPVPVKLQRIEIDSIVKTGRTGNSKKLIADEGMIESDKNTKLYTVTGLLYKNEVDTNKDEYDVSRNDESTSIRATGRGTLVHAFFEKYLSQIIDKGFNKSGDYIIHYNNEISTENEEMINEVTIMIKNILECKDFTTLFNDHKQIYTELDIIFKKPDDAGNDQIINGIIDLVIEYDDRIVLLDYKTYSGDLPRDEKLDNYKRQLEFYEFASSYLFNGKKITKALMFTGRKQASLVMV